MTRAGKPAGPRLWSALVALAAPASDRFSILEDLAEEYADRLARTPVTADSWYRRQALSSLLPLLGRRLQLGARRFAPHPRGTAAVSTVLNDIRFGWRNLRATPLLSLLVVAVLALGIGANTAIFSLMNPILLRPLPYRDADRLMHMFQVDPNVSGFGFDMIRQSLPTLRAWQEAETLEQVAGYYYNDTSLRTEEAGARSLTTGYVSAHLFAMLGVEPAIGRNFLPEEGSPGRDDVLLLSDAQWRSQFGGDPSVVGRQVFLAGEPHTVIGVMEPAFNFPYGEVRAWKPATFDAATWGPDDHNILTLARLRPGVGKEQAREELAGILVGLGEEYGGVYAERGVRVVELRRALVFFYDILGAMMMALLFAAGFVLLIVCANVANLLLSQVGRRRRELAVRAALGAGRGRILRQLLTENTLLAAVAGIVGVALARAGIGLIAPVVPAALYRVGQIEVETTATLFAVGLTLLTVLGFGLVPALRSSDIRVTEALKESPRSGFRGRLLTRALVFGQVLMATFLCGGAFLAVEVSRTFSSVELGFEPEGVLAVPLSVPRADYPDGAEVREFYRQARNAVMGLPGAEAAGWISDLPLNFASAARSYRVPGSGLDGSAPAPQAGHAVIGPGYVEAMRIPLIRGRDFDARDTSDSGPVVLINRMLADRAWPRSDAVGETLLLDSGDDAVEATVIGVVGDTVGGIAMDGLREQIYSPLSQRTYRRAFLTVRAAGDPGSLTAAVRAAFARINPELPVDQVLTMTEVTAGAAAPLVTVRNLLAGLGLFALLLAALGVYGVVAHSVTQRIHEIGVRMALGARPAHIRRTMMQALVITASVAALLGAIGALGLQVALNAAAGDGSSINPIGPAIVAAALVGVATLAAWLPTRRATRIDPQLALRMQ